MVPGCRAGPRIRRRPAGDGGDGGGDTKGDGGDGQGDEGPNSGGDDGQNDGGGDGGNNCEAQFDNCLAEDNPPALCEKLLASCQGGGYEGGEAGSGDPDTGIPGEDGG